MDSQEDRIIEQSLSFLESFDQAHGSTPMCEGVGGKIDPKQPQLCRKVLFWNKRTPQGCSSRSNYEFLTKLDSSEKQARVD